MQAREVPTSPKFRSKDEPASMAPARGWLLLSLAISILGGAAAGLVSAFWLVGQERFASLLVSPRNVLPSPARSSAPWAEIAQNVQSKMVTVVRSRSSVHPSLDRGPLLDEDVRGFALRLTHDGWLVTTRQVLGEGSEKVDLLLENGDLFPFIPSATDPATGLVFGKAEGAGGSAADFAEDSDVRVGENEIALFPRLDRRGDLQTVVLRSRDARPIDDVKDLVHSSDRLESRLGMGSWPSDHASPGIAVNARGEIVGMEEMRNGDEALIIPLWHCRKIFDSLFRTGEISRSRLGVSWVRPSSMPMLQTKWSGDDADAALIFSFEENGGVDPLGPAAATLRSGDLVRSVNGNRITADRSLSSWIQSFDPNSIASFDVLRDGKTLTLEVLLGSQE